MFKKKLKLVHSSGNCSVKMSGVLVGDVLGNYGPLVGPLVGLLVGPTGGSTPVGPLIRFSIGSTHWCVVF
jgi:hypothetical protein